MDHVGTAAPAVRRPRCIGPQDFVFGLSFSRSTWRTRTCQGSRKNCPKRCEEIPTSSTSLVFLKARALRAPEGPMECSSGKKAVVRLRREWFGETVAHFGQQRHL